MVFGFFKESINISALHILIQFPSYRFHTLTRQDETILISNLLKLQMLHLSVQSKIASWCQTKPEEEPRLHLLQMHLFVTIGHKSNVFPVGINLTKLLSTRGTELSSLIDAQRADNLMSMWCVLGDK